MSQEVARVPAAFDDAASRSRSVSVHPTSREPTPLTARLSDRVDLGVLDGRTLTGRVVRRSPLCRRLQSRHRKSSTSTG